MSPTRIVVWCLGLGLLGLIAAVFATNYLSDRSTEAHKMLQRHLRLWVSGKPNAARPPAYSSVTPPSSFEILSVVRHDPPAWITREARDPEIQRKFRDRGADLTRWTAPSYLFKVAVDFKSQSGQPLRKFLDISLRYLPKDPDHRSWHWYIQDRSVDDPDSWQEPAEPPRLSAEKVNPESLLPPEGPEDTPQDSPQVAEARRFLVAELDRLIEGKPTMPLEAYGLQYYMIQDFPPGSPNEKRPTFPHHYNVEKAATHERSGYVEHRFTVSYRLPGPSGSSLVLTDFGLHWDVKANQWRLNGTLIRDWQGHIGADGKKNGIAPFNARDGFADPQALCQQAEELKELTPEKSLSLLDQARGLPHDAALGDRINRLSQELHRPDVLHRQAVSCKKSNPDRARSLLEEALNLQAMDLEPTNDIKQNLRQQILKLLAELDHQRRPGAAAVPF